MEKTKLPTYIIVETQVFIDDRLSSTDKLIYSFISALANNYTKRCFANNKYLAFIMKTDTRTIQRTLKKLEDYNYISIFIKNKNNRIIIPKINEFVESREDLPNQNLEYIENYDWLNDNIAT